MTTTAPSSFGGLSIMSASEASGFGFCMALYGPAGVGKTSLAARACKSKKYGHPTAVLDAEGGSSSISHYGDELQILPGKTISGSPIVLTWDMIEKFVRALQTTPAENIPWKTLIFDNLSEYQALCTRSVAGDGPVQIQHHGQVTAKMLWMTRTLRDMSRVKGINVILIAWDAPERDEATGTIKRDVGFTPSLARQFPGIVDMVGHLTVATAGKRKLSFAASNTSAAKFRRSLSDRARDIPLELVFREEDTLMEDLLATLKGGEEFPSAKYVVRAATSQS